MKKRILALIIAAVLMCGVLPAQIFAAVSDSIVGGTYYVASALPEVRGHTDLSEVVSNYPNGSVLAPGTKVTLETSASNAVVFYIAYPSGQRPNDPFIWESNNTNRVSIIVNQNLTIEAFAETASNDLLNNSRGTVSVFNYTVSSTNVYSVTFVDWDGKTLSVQSVSRGQSAVPPSNPYRTNYTFTGWSSGSYSNVQSDLTITAQYKENVLDPFTMGEDNFQFVNTASSFGYTSGYSIPLERFLEIYSPTIANSYYKSFSPWGGNCYGFAAASYALAARKLIPSSYQSGVKNTYNFSTPYSPNSPVTKLIELFQISQFLGESLNEEYGGNYDNLKALVAAVNNEDGLIVILKGTAGGHAVICYGIEYIGGYKYLLKIYDSNQPNNENLRIEVDTSKSGSAGWQFVGDTQNYNSRLHEHISFINGETVYNAIEQAKRTKSSSGVMQILASSDAQITNSVGKGLKDISGAYKVTPNAVLPYGDNSVQTSNMEVWFVPEDVYSIKMPPTISGSVIVCNADESFEIKSDNGGAKIECTVGEESFARIVAIDDNAYVELSYATNDTINTPATIRTENGGVFEAIADDNGKLIISGNVGEVTIISGHENVQKSISSPKTITLQIGSPYMYVNGVKKEIYPGESVAAIIINDRTFVPIRAIAEELGAIVEWESNTQTVTIKRYGTTIKLRVNSNIVDVNGIQSQYDAAPQLIGGRTMIPLRVVMENLDCAVDWNDIIKTVTITG